MSKLKIYNPLSLDIDKDEPTFVNEQGVKWWLVSRGSYMSDTQESDPETLWRVKPQNSNGAYVVMSGNDVVYNTSKLEDALFKIDELFLIRTKK